MCIRRKHEKWLVEDKNLLLALYEKGMNHETLAGMFDLFDAKSVRGTVCKFRK